MTHPHPSVPQPVPLLWPGRTCWRTAQAGRAAFVIDGAAYFAQAMEAIRRARRSILLLGWDFVPETVLNPDAPVEQRCRIGDLLGEVAGRNPDLAVRVLLWDNAAFFALKRGQPPGAQREAGGSRVDVRFDAHHPPLACHHQKVLVVDDAVAFCGGIDFADNRWDTRDHPAEDPRRRAVGGDSYEPRHDVMLAVDGEAALALGDLARDRWRRATGEVLAPVAAAERGDPWPSTLRPDVTGVEVGIVRTQPAWGDQPEVREAERLYVDAIAVARQNIYLESQYFASFVVGEALARRLQDPRGPEVVVLVPDAAPSWIEQQGMDAARGRLIAELKRYDRFGRFHIYAPLTRGRPITVHSKLMVVDDRLVRIGSSNLSERSLGVDTECDLAIEATGHRRDVHAAIRRFRNGLLAEHLGTTPLAVAAEIARRGSLAAAIHQLNQGASDRALRPVDPGPEVGALPRLIHATVADPRRPWGSDLAATARRSSGWLTALTVGMVAGGVLAAAAVRREGGPKKEIP